MREELLHVIRSIIASWEPEIRTQIKEHFDEFDIPEKYLDVVRKAIFLEEGAPI